MLNDYSVCITALIHKSEVYVLDVLRERLIFPKLVKRVDGGTPRRPPQGVLIEDAASGQQLIQHLWHEQPKGVPRAVRIRPDGDKVTRMARASSRIEAGELLLPKEAPWLADFEREILGFPNGRHDDQVDAFSQLLNWSQRNPYLDIFALAGPIVSTRTGAWRGRIGLGESELPDCRCGGLSSLQVRRLGRITRQTFWIDLRDAPEPSADRRRPPSPCAPCVSSRAQPPGSSGGRALRPNPRAMACADRTAL